jgi:hypothetical protein
MQPENKESIVTQSKHEIHKNKKIQSKVKNDRHDGFKKRSSRGLRTWSPTVLLASPEQA